MSTDDNDTGTPSTSHFLRIRQLEKEAKDAKKKAAKWKERAQAAPPAAPPPLPPAPTPPTLREQFDALPSSDGGLARRLFLLAHQREWAALGQGEMDAWIRGRR